MNEKQMEAIKSLEKAFIQCAKAKIDFFATGSDIYAVPKGFGDHKDIGEIVNDEEKARLLKTSNTYRDCGML